MAVAAALALSLGGCDELCNEGAITWCQDEQSDATLNHAPRLGDEISVESRLQDPNFTPRSRGVALVDFATHLFVGATDPDADPMLVEWDLDGDGEFDQSRVHRNRDPVPRIVEFYRAPARLRVRVRVSDFPSRLGIPGETSRERMLAVVDPNGNREPTAAFAIRPTLARAGDPVTFDGSASSDPDFFDNPPFNPLDFTWDFGDRTLVRTGRGLSTITHTFATPGTYRIRLHVADSVRGGSVLDKTLTVLEAGAPNLPPTARFSVVPSVPVVGQSVRLDGSLSSDPEGPLARFEWDLDGNGSFETNGGRSPVTSTSFVTPGEKFIVLRVTDERGATATVRRVINVLREPLPPRAGAVRSRRGPGAPPALDGPGLLGPPGRHEQAGRGGHAPPARPATVPERSGRRRPAVGPCPRGARSLLARRAQPAPLPARAMEYPDQLQPRPSQPPPERSRHRARSPPRGRKASACLRVRLAAGPGRVSTGRLTLLGGTGAGARLRGGATLRFRLEPSGSATVLGRVTARRGAARRLPARCRSLARR